MEKAQLVHLLQHYSGSSEKEAQEVAALRDAYPYCQVFQVLAARASKDHGWSNQQSLLQMAAVTSTDRTVLKEIMAALYAPAVIKIVKVAEASAAETPVKEKIDASLDTIDVADKVIRDLKKLKELKQNFESLFMNTGNTPLIKTTPVVPVKLSTAPEKPVRTEQPGGEKSQKSKKERIIELAKGLEPPASSEPTIHVEPKVIAKKTEGDPLIQEIKSTKKKIKPESEKTKEQIEIINQFIKSKPVMAPPKILPAEGTESDLSSSLKSGEFGDNIISETLVEILLKQGKKDKAIEVLKKLIWKFPQKKAYFAAQIDELKK